MQRDTANIPFFHVCRIGGVGWSNRFQVLPKVGAGGGSVFEAEIHRLSPRDGDDDGSEGGSSPEGSSSPRLSSLGSSVPLRRLKSSYMGRSSTDPSSPRSWDDAWASSPTLIGGGARHLSVEEAGQGGASFEAEVRSDGQDTVLKAVRESRDVAKRAGLTAEQLYLARYKSQPCQLKIGQMNIQVFEQGSRKLLATWLYAELKGWQYQPEDCCLALKIKVRASATDKQASVQDSPEAIARHCMNSVDGAIGHQHAVRHVHRHSLLLVAWVL
jgi:hypothetical protein